jgi:hypothetical protein
MHLWNSGLLQRDYTALYSRELSIFKGTVNFKILPESYEICARQIYILNLGAERKWNGKKISLYIFTHSYIKEEICELVILNTDT